MIPFDPCLPYRLRDLHAETQKKRIPCHEDKISRLHAFTDWLEIMLIIVKIQSVSKLHKYYVWRIKRMHVPLTLSMLSAFIDVVYGSMMHCLLGGELLSNWRYLLFQLVMSPVILYCNILPILNAILIPKRNTIRPICVFEVCYFVEFVPQRLLLYIRCLWNLHLTRDIERHAEAWAYI